MTDLLRHRCELLVGNRKIIQDNFKHESIYLKNISATIAASEYCVTDCAGIEKAKDYIKKNTGRFSSLRSYSITAFATILSLDPFPEKRFDRAVKISDALKKAGFMPSQPLAVASLLLSAEADIPISEIAQKTKAIYDLINVGRTFSSGHGNNIIISAAIALSDIDFASVAYNIEECYSKLRSHFPAGTAKTLAGLLSLDKDNASRDADRLINIKNKMKEYGYSFGKQTDAAVLSVLAIINAPENDITKSLIETYEYLKKERGFGITLGKKLRMMFAAVQVFGDYVTVERNKLGKKEEEIPNEIKALRLAEKAVISLLIVYGIYIDNY